MWVVEGGHVFALGEGAFVSLEDAVEEDLLVVVLALGIPPAGVYQGVGCFAGYFSVVFEDGLDLTRQRLDFCVTKECAGRSCGRPSSWALEYSFGLSGGD